MINATQMAKPFGKRPIDYLRLPSTNELLNAIVRKSHIDKNQLVKTERGGDNPGTWMHEDVALDFAQWLSVDFRLWCNDKIKELMKTGVTTMSNDDEAIAYAMGVLQKRLEQARQEKAMLEQQNNYLANEIKQVAPKVVYYDQTLQSAHTYTSTQMAKELNIRTAEHFTRFSKKRASCSTSRGNGCSRHATARMATRSRARPCTPVLTARKARTR